MENIIEILSGVLFLLLMLWPLVSSLYSIRYLINSIHNYKYNPDFYDRPSFGLILSSIIDLIIILIYIINYFTHSDFGCAYQDTSCLIFVPIFISGFINFIFRTFIYALFSKLKLKKVGIKPKINPIIIWIIIIFSIIFLPYGVYLEKYGAGIFNKSIDITYIDSIIDIPAKYSNYIKLDVKSSTVNNIYDNFKDYNGKKVIIYGYHNEYTDEDNAYSFRILTSDSNYSKFKNYFNGSSAYVIVVGKIKSKAEYENDDWTEYYVNVKPSKVYVVKNKSINYDYYDEDN